jgi:hypothetical protein
MQRLMQSLDRKGSMSTRLLLFCLLDSLRFVHKLEVWRVKGRVSSDSLTDLRPLLVVVAMTSENDRYSWSWYPSGG